MCLVVVRFGDYCSIEVKRLLALGGKWGRIMAATRVTIDELKERLDRGEQFAFVDTRNPKAWAEAEKKLPGAIRIPADEAEQHLGEIPKDRTVITYCT